MQVTLREAADHDLDRLATMNERLVVDQGSQPWTHDRFRDRFREWLQSGEWSVDVIFCGDQINGYAAYQIQPDHYNPDENVVFIRHFYIERTVRRQGLGTAAFTALKRRLPPGLSISLEVVSSNPAGQVFWKKVGFSPTYTSMMLQPDTDS